MAKNKRKRRKVNTRFFLALFIIVLSAVVLFLTPLFNIEKIEITGNGKVSDEVILTAAEIKTGKNIFMTNLGKAEKSIRKVQYIEDVNVKRKLPGKIRIEIIEGDVAAYLDFEKNYVGINKKGKTLCFIEKENISEAAPVVKGLTVLENTMGEAVLVQERTRYETLLRLLSTFDQLELGESITSIDVTSADYIVFRYKENLKIEFGDLSDYENKFYYLTAILDELGSEPSGVINMHSENYVYRNTIA